MHRLFGNLHGKKQNHYVSLKVCPGAPLKYVSCSCCSCPAGINIISPLHQRHISLPNLLVPELLASANSHSGHEQPAHSLETAGPKRLEASVLCVLVGLPSQEGGSEGLRKSVHPPTPVRKVNRRSEASHCCSGT